MNISHRLVLHFPSNIVNKPIIYTLVKDCNLVFNIMRANITPDEEGIMVMELSGSEKDYEKGINYLKSLGVKIQPLSQDIRRDDERCAHCGACITFCPSKALYVDRKTMKVYFDNEKCSACEICVKACPPHAMELHF